MPLKLFQVTWDADTYLIAAEAESAAALEVASLVDQADAGESPTVQEINEETARSWKVSDDGKEISAWDLFQAAKAESVTGEAVTIAAPVQLC